MQEFCKLVFRKMGSILTKAQKSPCAMFGSKLLLIKYIDKFI